MFCIILSLSLNLPASKLPENIAVPVVVSTLNTSDVPSSTIKSTFVPPLNVKSPPPLVSKVRGTSISVPSVTIVVLLFIERLALEVPTFNFGVAVSTLKNGVEDPRVVLTCNPVVSRTLRESILIFSVPATEMPILFADSLKSPVVDESVLEKLREGDAAVPSSIFTAALSIEESAPLTVIPPLKVACPVNVDVC